MDLHSSGVEGAVPRGSRLPARHVPSSEEGAPLPTEPGSDLRRYGQIVRARWRVLAGVLTGVFVAVGAGTLLQPRVYVARGTIEVRRAAAEVVPVEALFQAPRLSTQYLETQYGVLRSPALARRVVEKLDLTGVEELNPALDADASGEPVDSAEILARVVGEFQERLVVDPLTGSQLIRVQFEAADPLLAARVVNALFQEYAAMRAEAGRSAVAHLSAQMVAVRNRLALAETRLLDFLRANELPVVENGAGEAESIPLARLRQLQQQLTEAEAERYRTESRYDLLQRPGDEFLDSDVLRSLSVRAADLRGEYARLRSTFTEDYPRTRQVKTQLEELEALLSGERGRIRGEIASSYAAAVRRQDLLQRALDDQKALIDALRGRTAEYQMLAREVEAHEQLHAVLQQRLREAEVSAALVGTEVDVVDRAVAPLDPARPQPYRNLQLALVVGLVLGLGVVFLLEHTDPTIHSIQEVDTLPVPLLGLIPSIPSAAEPSPARLRPGGRRWPRLLSAGRPGEETGASWPRIDRLGSSEIPLAEAFGSLRTSVLLEGQGHSARSLLFSSAQPGDGKTTVSVNLAISLAKLGRRVLLVDADLRRPSVHRVLGTCPRPGLAEFLTGPADWRALVREVAPGLDLLSAGSPPGNPTELLSHDRMRALVAEATAAYDFVLLDSPALFLHAADARVLAPLLDGVVVVIRSGVTPRQIVQRVLRRVPNLVGVVLNDLPAFHFPSYYRTYERSTDAAAPGGGTSGISS